MADLNSTKLGGSTSLIKNGGVNQQIIALQKGYLRNTLHLFFICSSFYNLSGYFQRVMFVLSLRL